MAQPAHVPKFGNWENDNIPYTTYFDNARKDKGPGTKIFNPNDPEQNPDAFMSGIFPTQFELKNADSSQEGYKLNQGVNAEITARSKNVKSGNSKFGSDKSSSDYSDRKQSKHLDDDSFQAPPQKQLMLKQGRDPRPDAMHDMPSSVPKFGIWDEKDPRSGDGFTVIFNKVKQEKHIAATKLPQIPSDSTTNSSKHRHDEKPCSISKIICCFRPAVKE